jgi:hypothetical protein
MNCQKKHKVHDGKISRHRKIKSSSYSSNITRSKSLGHNPIMPCWALITESMTCVTKVEWYRAHISTFFNHPAFSKRHKTFPTLVAKKLHNCFKTFTEAIYPLKKLKKIICKFYFHFVLL